MNKLTSATPVWLPALLDKLLFPLNQQNPMIALAALEKAMNAALDAVEDGQNNIENAAVREVGVLLEKLCNDARQNHISIPPAQQRPLRRR
jgi:hypothetical protein